MLTQIIHATGFIKTNLVPDADGRASLYWPLGIANNELFVASERHHLVSFNLSWYIQPNSWNTHTIGTRRVWMMAGNHGLAASLSGQFMDNPARMWLYINGTLLVTLANIPEGAANDAGVDELYSQYGVFDIGRITIGTTGWQELAYDSWVTKPAYSGTNAYERKGFTWSIWDSLLWAPGPAFAEGMTIEL